MPEDKTKVPALYYEQINKQIINVINQQTQKYIRR